MSITNGQDASAPQYTFQFARHRYYSGVDSYYPSDVGWRDWNTDYTDFAETSMEMHLEAGVKRLTNIAIGPSAVVNFREDGERVFQFPLLYTVEPEQMVLDAPEARLLREWLHRGGFWILDDFHGCEEMEYVMKQFARVFGYQPKFQKLADTHEIFHTAFDIGIEQVPWEGLVTNCVEDCRTWEAEPPCHESNIMLWDGGPEDGKILLLHNNDTGDGLEHADYAAYPAKYTIYAYRLIINSIVYAMTH